MAQENEDGVRTFTAGEVLEAHRRVKLNSSGNAVYADASDDGIGYTVDAQLTSGNLVSVKLHNFPGTRKVTAVAAVTKGAAVYGAADGKVNDAWGSNAPLLGVALEAADGDDSLLEILPEKGGSKLLYNIIAQSAAGGTSDAAEFTFSNGTLTIPAGQIREGDEFHVHMQGQLPATNGADTFKGRLYVGTEKIAETPAPDAVNDDVFAIDAVICVREASATGKLTAQGRSYNDALAAGLDLPFRLVEAAEDLTGAITITARGLFSASSAGNEARLQQFSVVRVRK